MVVPTEQLNDFLDYIFTGWPRDIYLRATLGCMKLIRDSVSDVDLNHGLNKACDRFAIIIDDPSKENYEKLALSRQVNYWQLGVTGRQYILLSEANRMMLSSRKSPVRIHMSVRRVGALFKDKIFRKAIGESVIPYLLGEWK